MRRLISQTASVSWVDVTTAIGTAGSAIVALALGVNAQYRGGRADRVQRDRSAMAQAELVGAWTSTVLPDDPYVELRIRIRKGSRRRVYHVSMQIVLGVCGTFVRRIEAMGPDETREFRILSPTYPRTAFLTPPIRFADVAGRSWFREASGRLRPLSDKD